MNKKRLLKMADFVETIPAEHFDMSLYLNTCGTVGCALGLAAQKKLFRGLHVERSKVSNVPFPVFDGWFGMDAAEVLFKISEEQALGLFLSKVGNETPPDVAANIRRFVETGALP